MASISSPGVGSGIDVGSLVTQLVEAEGQAAALRLESREVSAQTEISALGALKSAASLFKSSLDALKSASTFNARSAVSADEEVFTASADSDAVAGSFDLEVVRLARPHKLISGGHAGPGSGVGTGTLTLSSGGSSFSVSVGAGEGSVAQIRDAINDADDNPGILATIISVDDGSGGSESKLVLTASATGSAGEISVTAADDDGNDTDASGLSTLVYDPDGSGTTRLGELQGAVDAQLKLGTETITRSSNVIDDAIDGITLTLHKASAADETTELSISADTAAVSGAIGDLVSNYNGLMSIFDSLASYDTETGEAGVLLGDATLRGVERVVRRELSAQFSGLGGGVESLASLGITTRGDGTLTLDSATLNGVLDANPEAVASMFSGDAGMASRLSEALEPFVRLNGTIDSRTSGLGDRLLDIADQREVLDRRLGALETRLLAQFAAMDAIVGSLQTTSTFLTQQFDALSGNTGKK